jgi:hypothetical protein
VPSVLYVTQLDPGIKGDELTAHFRCVCRSVDGGQDVEYWGSGVGALGKVARVRLSTQHLFHPNLKTLAVWSLHFALLLLLSSASRLA